MWNRCTETHAAQSLEYRQYDDPSNIAFAFDSEHQDHEDQYESGLAAHHHELRDHMREEDLARRYTCHPASIQQALHPLDNESGWRERDRQEKDNTADTRQTILSKLVSEIFLLCFSYARIFINYYY